MDLSSIVVCSFYTADDYYRAHGEHLQKNLSDIGVAHELAEIEKAPGEDWADICRKKIAFLNGVCERNPDKLVFWIDVDCKLLALPAYIADSTADLIGFQRGFSTPATIGYASRTRFWEPCFFGINTTPAARKFLADAAELERTADVKATDDYFFEESWRANAPFMTFQVISSAACSGKPNDGSVEVFFDFGSSGNVDEFKGKVVQHRHDAAVRGRMPARRRMLDLAKRVERLIAARSGPLAGRLRLLADKVGVTHVLTTDGAARGRDRLLTDLVKAGVAGDLQAVASSSAALAQDGLTTPREEAAQHVAEAFAHYATTGSERPSIPLMWWQRPYPGNFGDWLSPLLLRSAADHPITFLPPTQPMHQPHLVMLGSIGRFIKPRSIVVGTGVSSEDLALDPKAAYVSLRGPITAKLLRTSGGPKIESFGDPGALLSRVLPVQRGATNGRIAFIRHHSHAQLPVVLPDHVDELSVLMSKPEEIAAFVAALNTYEAVVTSAMHVMIACHSYGIPCAMVGFKGFEAAVHGTGVKYRDYCAGADLSGVWEPTAVDLNLTRVNLDDLIHTEKITPAKADEIERAITAGVTHYLNRVG